MVTRLDIEINLEIDWLAFYYEISRRSWCCGLVVRKMVHTVKRVSENCYWIQNLIVINPKSNAIFTSVLGSVYSISLIVIVILNYTITKLLTS